MNYFITGIGTDVGKTICSAILVEALKADYWKPVQCGYPRDTQTVASLVSNTTSQFHKEGILLDEPASPHQAAFNQGITLSLKDLQLPSTQNHLVVEGAGGLMVPLNHQEYMVDLGKKFCHEVILVVSMYLGCINHSLLSIDLLRNREIPLKGIIFNGAVNEHSQSAILQYSQSKKLLQIPPKMVIDQKSIKLWAQELKKRWI